MHQRIRVVNDVRTLRDNQLAIVSFVQLAFVQHLLHEILGVLTLRVLLLQSLELLLKSCNVLFVLLRLLCVLTIHLILELLLLVLFFNLGLRAPPFAAGLHEVSAITLAC